MQQRAAGGRRGRHLHGKYDYLTIIPTLSIDAFTRGTILPNFIPILFETPEL